MNRAALGLLLLAFAGQGLVGYFSYRALLAVEVTSLATDRSHRVIQDLERLQSDVLEMESARRGWLLTSNAAYLLTYGELRRSIFTRLEELKLLLAGDPAQRHNLEILAERVQRKVDHMNLLDVARGRRPEVLRTGRELMDAAREQFDRMEEVERAVLQHRSAVSTAQGRDAMRMVLVGNASSFVLLTASLAAFGWESRRRRRAELALSDSEQRYRTLVANVPDVSWIADADSNLRFISPNVADILGYSAEEIIASGKRFWEEHVHPEDHPQRFAAYRALFEHGQPYSMEYRIRHRDGRWLWLHARAAVVEESGGSKLANGLFSDITERKLVQQKNAVLQQALQATNLELERASRLKSQFLASMSHELRTPLNAIMGFSDLLSDQSAGPLNEKQARFVNHVRTGAAHLLRLINDVLDISKIEAGQMELHLEGLRFDEVLPEVLSLVRPLAMQGNIRLESDGVSASLRADRIRLKQILYNLLSNAIKFTPPGGRVSVECALLGDWAHISVSDTGVGIRPEDQAIIFEEFRQLGESTRGVREGTGLGLAITARIVALHGGQIRVESQPGQGSRFTFTMPLSASPASLPVVVTADATVSSAASPLILVIDDEPAASELITSFLAPEGYRLMTASSASEGLALAREHSPDLITLDILMPGGNGLGALFELRSDPATSAIPVVVVSIVDERSMGLSWGAREYLVKPIHRNTLLQVVQRQLARSSGSASILVIDDDIPTSSMICEELGKHGFRCRAVETGEAACQLLQSEPVDLILLDLMMPGMNGFEVLRRIKAEERLRCIPVVVITAKSLSPDEVEILKRDALACIEKLGPWQERLKADVRRLLASRTGEAR